MKSTKTVLVVALVAFASVAFGQAQLAIGVKAGPNFAKINTDATLGENYKSRTGFHGGAFVLVKLTKIGIQPEVIFSQQGSKVEVPTLGDREIKYSYMNIPIMFKLYTVAGINLQLGPQFGFVTKAEEVFTPIAGAKTTTDVKNSLKGSDLSLGIGLGWDLPFGLSIDGRYNLGLSKVNDSGSDDVKNQVIQVSLGYKLIKLGK